VNITGRIPETAAASSSSADDDWSSQEMLTSTVDMGWGNDDDADDDDDDDRCKIDTIGDGKIRLAPTTTTLLLDTTPLRFTIPATTSTQPQSDWLEQPP
jgi:hypothetical protein